MHAIRHLLRYIKHYQYNVVMNIVSNILMVFFNIISIPMLIPFLQILLGVTIPPTQKPELKLNLQSASQWFYYQIGQMIERYQSKEQALIFVCVCFVGVFLLKNLFRYAALYFITPMRNGIVRDLRQALYEKTLRLPLSYFSDERKGDLISRVTADVMEVEWSILNVLETIVREPLLIVGALSMMIYISPQLTGFVFILLIFTALIIGGIGKTLKKNSTALQERLGQLVSNLEESLGGVRVIKAFNAENYQRDRFLSLNNSYRQMMTALLRRRDLASPLTEFLGIGVVCVLIWFGFKQVLLHEADPTQGLDSAQFFAFLYAFFTVIEPSKAFSAASYNIRRGAGALSRIEAILDAEETIRDAETPHAWQAEQGFHTAIVYNNVSFFYKEGEKQILKNINLTIPKGKIVALVGASGAGKSTMADLLPRFYDTNEGQILVDGKDIKTLKIKELRKLMGIVTQEAILFNDTIYNNIVFGLEGVTEAQVIEAAKAANAHDFICATEGGYQTNIGDRGMKLSGGQRQRLTIARALLKNPDILILDEATSALDSESEKLVQAALNRLMQNRTALVIAHRLSTIQHADLIVVMHDGAIVEQGTHDSLLAQNGAYSKLVAMQGLI